MKYILAILAMIWAFYGIVFLANVVATQSQTLTPVATPLPLFVSSEGQPFACSPPTGTAQPPILVMDNGEWLACVPVKPQPTPTRIVVTRTSTRTATPTNLPEPSATATVKACASGKVLAAKLNVRSAPVNGKVVRVVSAGTVLSIAEIVNGWARLCGPVVEWVSADSRFLEVMK